jgi:hypothetical protein
MKKFTFKINKETGRYRSFYPDQCDIKLNKMVVGSISKSREHDYTIGLMVKKEVTEKDPAPFKWIFFNREFKTINDAKIALQEQAEKIFTKFDLYQMED